LEFLQFQSGGITGTVADPKAIFGWVLKTVGSGIIHAPNHLQVRCIPVKLIWIYKELKEGGKLLDIQVLDHIIITSEAYCAGLS
jgi:DNA repair protein RadC